MLTIRDAQMAALNANRRLDFERRLYSHLKGTLPTPGIEENLMEQIRRGILRGPEYGLVSEKHVAQFVEITLANLGGFPQGDLPKPALALLYSYGMDPDAKLDSYSEWAKRQGGASKNAVR